MSTQVSEHWPGLFRPNLRSELTFRERAKGVQIGDLAPKRGLAVPNALALLSQGARQSELAGAERQRPFVLVGQLSEALHRSALEALIDHLVQGERAAQFRSLAIAKR